MVAGGPRVCGKPLAEIEGWADTPPVVGSLVAGGGGGGSDTLYICNHWRELWAARKEKR